MYEGKFRPSNARHAFSRPISKGRWHIFSLIQTVSSNIRCTLDSKSTHTNICYFRFRVRSEVRATKSRVYTNNNSTSAIPKGTSIVRSYPRLVTGSKAQPSALNRKICSPKHLLHV